MRFYRSKVHTTQMNMCTCRFGFQGELPGFLSHIWLEKSIRHWGWRQASNLICLLVINLGIVESSIYRRFLHVFTFPIRISTQEVSQCHTWVPRQGIHLFVTHANHAHCCKPSPYWFEGKSTGNQGVTFQDMGVSVVDFPSLLDPQMVAQRPAAQGPKKRSNSKRTWQLWKRLSWTSSWKWWVPLNHLFWYDVPW